MTESIDSSVGLMPRIIAGAWFGAAALIPSVPFVFIVSAGSNHSAEPVGLLLFCETPVAVAVFFGFSIGAQIIDPQKRISSFRATLCGLLVAVLSLVVYLALYVLATYLTTPRAPYPAAARQWAIHMAPIIVEVGFVIMILPVSIVGSFAGWILFLWSRRPGTIAWLNRFPRVAPIRAFLLTAIVIVIVALSWLIPVYVFGQTQR